jgi:hypothetical protein
MRGERESPQRGSETSPISISRPPGLPNADTLILYRSGEATRNAVAAAA